METVSSLPIVIKSASAKQSSGQVQIQILSQTQRLFKAFTNGFIAFTCTLVTIIIPVFHLFLFPLGLIFTVFFAIKSYGKSSVILSGEGLCPECGNKIQIFKRPNVFPFQDVCENCRRQMTITTATI